MQNGKMEAAIGKLEAYAAAETVVKAFRSGAHDPVAATRGCLMAAGAILAKAGFDVTDDLLLADIRDIQRKAIDALEGKAQHSHPVQGHGLALAVDNTAGVDPDFDDDHKAALDRQGIGRPEDDRSNMI